MKKSVRRYSSENIDVLYDVKRCIHAAECVQRLPNVFDTSQRPWVQPDNATANAIAETVQACPTGALHYERKDGASVESSPAENQVRVSANGPLYVHGEIELDVAGTTVSDTRVALCRCGQSGNMPYCDNSHRDAGFEDAGNIAGESTDIDATGLLSIKPAPNGPLLLKGGHYLASDNGHTVVCASHQVLCRCGASGNKPFCDGSHKAIGFTTEESA